MSPTLRRPEPNAPVSDGSPRRARPAVCTLSGGYISSVLVVQSWRYRWYMAATRPSHDQVAQATASAEASMRPQSVPVNVYETPAALVVLAPLPAVTAKDVTIEVRPGSLRFWARLSQCRPS